MVKVLIIQSVVKRYREPFFTQLRDALLKQKIDLMVAYSDPTRSEATRKDQAHLSEEWGVKVKAVWLFNRLIYQPIWMLVFRADYVIVSSEIKYLNNPLLLLLCGLGLKEVAFWGLGPNMHPGRSNTAEWIKERLCSRVNWWFAYTEPVSAYLKSKRMPAERITSVQNATDTTELRRQMAGISDEEVVAAKIAMTGGSNHPIGFYCGALDRIKSMPFLIETARRVRSKLPDFHLILVGDGPERNLVESMIRDEPWIHFLGSKYGRDSALCYKMADVFLLGGTAGLAVVDSFAAGLPLLATQLPTHPPEIDYVIDGTNGRIAPHDEEAFASLIAETLSDPARMASLRAGAMESARQYTVEAMVENFAGGIRNWIAISGLNAESHRSNGTLPPSLPSQVPDAFADQGEEKPFLETLKFIGPIMTRARIKRDRVPILVLRAVWNILFMLPGQVKILRMLGRQPYKDIVRVYPRLPFKCVNPGYLALRFTRAERTACFLHHYRRLQETMPHHFLSRMLVEDVPLTEIATDAGSYRITLGPPTIWDKEGELSLNFQVNGQTVFVLCFTIVPGRVVGSDLPEVLLVSRVQGTTGSDRQIVSAIKALHYARPKTLLLAALQGIAEVLGISMMAAVSSLQFPSFKPEFSNQLRHAYDEFFEEMGATRDAAGFYCFPMPLPEKPLEEVKPENRRRKKMQRALKNQISADVSKFLRGQCCAETPSLALARQIPEPSTRGAQTTTFLRAR